MVQQRLLQRLSKLRYKKKNKTKKQNKTKEKGNVGQTKLRMRKKGGKSESNTNHTHMSEN